MQTATVGEGRGAATMALDALRGRLQAVFTLFLWLRVRWHVFYNRINAQYFLAAPLKVSDTSRRIISIGDGFAATIGDIAVIGSRVGLANRVNDLLEKNKTGETTLHMNWECIDRGVYGYTSDDWLPRDGSRFEKLFAEEGGEGVEADVVLLTVGAEDCRNVRSSKPADIKSYAAQVVKNISIIASDLASLDKIVFVAGVRCGAAQDGKCVDVAAMQLEVNTQLKKAIKELRKYYDTVHMGPTSQSRLLDNRLCYSFDGFHFSNQGYSLLARNWIRVIAPHLQKFEYDFVKEHFPVMIKAAKARADENHTAPVAVSTAAKKTE